MVEVTAICVYHLRDPFEKLNTAIVLILLVESGWVSILLNVRMIKVLQRYMYCTYLSCESVAGGLCSWSSVKSCSC